MNTTEPKFNVFNSNGINERDRVLKAGLPQLEEHVASLKKYPPIRSGTPDPYQPPQ